MNGALVNQKSIFFLWLCFCAKTKGYLMLAKVRFSQSVFKIKIQHVSALPKPIGFISWFTIKHEVYIDLDVIFHNIFCARYHSVSSIYHIESLLFSLSRKNILSVFGKTKNVDSFQLSVRVEVSSGCNLHFGW